MSTVCAAAPAPVTFVPFIAMNSTPLVSGAGVGDVEEGGSVGGGLEVELWPPDVGDGLSDGAAAEPESVKPFARTARPPTINATITRTLPVLRFTRASYRARPAAPNRTDPRYRVIPRRCAVRRLRRNARMPPEPAHQHRVVRDRLRAVDGAVQQLVIARGGEAEALADRAFLGHPQLPRLPLEIQELAVARTRAPRARRLGLGGRNGSGRLASVSRGSSTAANPTEVPELRQVRP